MCSDKQIGVEMSVDGGQTKRYLQISYDVDTIMCHSRLLTMSSLKQWCIWCVLLNVQVPLLSRTLLQWRAFVVRRPRDVKAKQVSWSSSTS